MKFPHKSQKWTSSLFRLSGHTTGPYTPRHIGRGNDISLKRVSIISFSVNFYNNVFNFSFNFSLQVNLLQLTD